LRSILLFYDPSAASLPASFSLHDALPISFPSAPLWRRLAALGYDILLLGAVMFVSVGLLVWLYQFTGLPMVELNGVAKPPAWFSAWVIRGVLLLLIVGFYGYFRSEEHTSE